MIGAVCNLLRPTAGEIRVFGHHHGSREARRLVGLAEQEINLDRFPDIGEILLYHAGYHGIGRRDARRRARELLDLFNLRDKAKSCQLPSMSGEIIDIIVSLAKRTTSSAGTRNGVHRGPRNTYPGRRLAPGGRARWRRLAPGRMARAGRPA